MPCRRIFTALALVAASFPAALEARAAEYTLSFATLSTADAAQYHDIFEPLAGQIEKDSGGRIKIDMRPLGGYGKPADHIPMLERGELDIAYGVQGYTPDKFPLSTVMELPLMYSDSVTGTKAFWQLYKEGLLEKDYANYKILALFVLPPYGIFTVDRNITALKDLRGLRIRTPSPTVGLALARLGAIPVGLPVNVLPESLENGVINAAAFGWDTLHTNRAPDGRTSEELVKYMLDANFAAPALMIAMNKKKYESLPEDLRKVIDAHTGGDWAIALAKYREAGEAAAKQRLAKDPAHTVIALSDEQREQMRKTIEPAVAEWANGLKKRGIDADKLLARARELMAPPARTN
jgi:TRAP-type C4-dicarboxylate transport system substrate-binding protein